MNDVHFLPMESRPTEYQLEVRPDRRTYIVLRPNERTSVLAELLRQLRQWIRRENAGSLVEPLDIGSRRAFAEKLIRSTASPSKDDELSSSLGLRLGDGPKNVKYFWVKNKFVCVQCSQIVVEDQSPVGDSNPLILQSQDYPEITATVWLATHTTLLKLED